jgi:Tol biopolymer transport system component
MPIAQRAGVDLSVFRSKFSASGNGVLVYGAGSGTSQLLWFDRTGTPLGSLEPPGNHIDFRISPDGRRVAAQRFVETGRENIFLLELARGTSARFTFEPTYHAGPVWAPDGSRLTFFKGRDGRWSIWEKASSGAGAQRLLLSTSNDVLPNDWSPDGRFLLYSERAPNTRMDLWVLAARGVGSDPPRGTPFVRTQWDENFARFSPDGRWVVYQSNQTGRYEIYVRKFPADDSGPGGKLISTGGGIEPRWPRRGKEIFYIGSDNMLMAVDVRSGATIEAGVPRPLFPTRPVGVLRYDVTADGQRFLVATPTDEAVSAPVTVVLNWFGELRRRVPTR